MDSLTTKQAYIAMMAFLEGYYKKTKSDAVGGLLGGMSFLPDGGTADPAVWGEWLECVHRVLSGAITDSDFDLRLGS